jgi:uncharacterized membrane protein
MTGVAFALVIGSAFAHATWNFLLKRSGDKVAFLWSLGFVASCGLVVPAVVVGVVDGIGWTAVMYGAVSGAIHGLYGIALARGYHLGDLSRVYPVARGMGPALVPVMAVVFLDETISAVAAVGIALVVVGIYAVHLESGLLSEVRRPLRLVTAPETQMALLTGVLIASYSVWDKAALDHLSPVTLNGFSMAGHMLVLTPLALYLGGGTGTIREEWRTHGRSAVVAGVLAPLGYLMVLAALTTSRISYVAPAREIGIVLGAAMGVLLLHEGYGSARIAGAALIVAGVITLAVAP